MKTQIWNTDLIDQAEIAPSAKSTEGQIVYSPNEHLDKRSDELDSTKGKTSAKEFADALREYAVHRIVNHVVKAMKFDTLSASRPTHQHTIRSSVLSTSPNISFLATGAE